MSRSDNAAIKNEQKIYPSFARVFLSKMAKEKKEKVAPREFKGYDIRWLKEVKAEHPDGYLVDEYEKEYGEIK